MYQYQPKILKANAVSDTQWQLELEIQPTLFWFQGHFPETPILPGVVQITWARQQAMKLWPHALDWLSRLGGMEAVKFQQVIRPGDCVLLSLELDVERQRLSFQYEAADPASDHKYASGRMVLAQ